MTEEEYFRKNYPDSCYGDRLLSPYWDFFQDGVEFGERQSEKKIEELEKENEELKKKCYKKAVKDYCELEKKNAELKKELKDANEKVVHLACNQNKDLKYKLTKTTELLNEFMRISKASDEDFEHDYSELIGETEQFLEKVK